MGSLLARCHDSCEECFLRDEAKEINIVQDEIRIMRQAVKEVERNVLLSCC